MNSEIIEKLEQNRSAFAEVLGRCMSQYLPTDKGQEHKADYNISRLQAQQNWPQIVAEEAAGHDITDLVINKVIGHQKRRNMDFSVEWMSPCGSAAPDLRSYYQGSGRVQPDGWPQVTRAIFKFEKRVLDSPDELEPAIREYLDTGLAKGFAAGLLSPLLNALYPDQFCVANGNSVNALKHFSKFRTTTDLRDYPKTNAAMRQLLSTYEDEIAPFVEPGFEPCDVFDMLSYWISPSFKTRPPSGPPLFLGTDNSSVTGTELDEEDEDSIGEEDVDTPDNILPVNDVYSLEQLAADCLIGIPELNQWIRAVQRKGQAIFYGPPGTGKTYLAQRLARHLTSGSDGLVELVQFHPSYGYEDFMQGIRPLVQEKPGQTGTSSFYYDMVPGRFLTFCEEAIKRTGTCVLIIDEINRAELSRVFGELMYLLEYRSLSAGTTSPDFEIPLAGGKKFSIPHNVRIIGTMNTADRSIALVDHALRRRFAFVAINPDFALLKRFHSTHNPAFPIGGLVQQLEKINTAIGDPHYALGVSFFLKQNLADHFQDIWELEIEPYLEEYFFDRRKVAEDFKWAKIQGAVFNSSQQPSGTESPDSANDGDLIALPLNSEVEDLSEDVDE